jgi:alkylation response protein AidB-like acyl-CoA dehydrogenase
MNFDFPENRETFRSKLKILFEPPGEPCTVRPQDKDSERLRTLLPALADAGYLSIGLEDGKNSAELLAAREVLAALSPSLFLAVEASTRIFGRFLAVYGTADQKNELLPALRDGRLTGAVGLTEEGMSLKDNPVQTKGAKDGEGFRVTGTKGHVVNGPVADWIAIAGQWDNRTAFFLIPNPSEGFFCEERLCTLGYEEVAVSPVTLHNCFVPERSVTGPFPDDEVLLRVRSWEDEILSAASLGLMQGALDEASSFAKEHRSGGKPIIAYQEVAFKLAEMLTLLQAARLLAYRAAWMAESGHKEAAALAHCAKVFCTEAAEKVTSSALQILGQQGWVLGNSAEKGYRDAKYLQIAGTSSEISRMRIGDLLLEGR